MADVVGGTIVWNLDAITKGLEDGLNKASDKLDGMKGKMQAAERGSQAFAAGLAVVGAAAVGFGISSVNAFNAAEVAQTKLATNLLNVKGNTMANVDALSKLASQLQNVGVIEDDVIKAGMSQLATFNLQGDTIAKLTPKITDMVAQMKGHNATAEDMVGINNLVGKVMTGNVGALSRYGVTLSEAQAALLKNGNETERANVLNEVLAQNYGKVNEALRNTPQGQITAFKNAFGDFQEVVGGAILNGLTPFIKGLNDLMAGMGGPEEMFRKLSAAMKPIADNLPIVIGLIIGGLTPALYGLASGFIAVMAPLVPFLLIGAAVGLAVKLLIDAFGGWDNMMKAIQPTIQMLSDIFNKWILPPLKDIWSMISTQLIPALVDLWNVVSPILIPVLKVLGTILGVTIIASIVAVINIIKLFVAIITGVVSTVAWVATNVANIIGAIPNAVNAAVSRVRDFLIKPFQDAWNFIKGIIDRIRNELDRINPFHRESPSLVDNVTRGLGIIKDQFSSLGEISLDPIAHVFDVPDFAMAQPASPFTQTSAGSSSAPGAKGDVKIYIDHVNDMQDVQALGREMGFRQSLIK